MLCVENVTSLEQSGATVTISSAAIVSCEEGKRQQTKGLWIRIPLWHGAQTRLYQRSNEDSGCHSGGQLMDNLENLLACDWKKLTGKAQVVNAQKDERKVHFA